MSNNQILKKSVVVCEKHVFTRMHAYVKANYFVYGFINNIK